MGKEGGSFLVARIIVLGGDGMLGHKMFQFLGSRFPDTFCTIRGFINDDFHKKIDLFQRGNVFESVNAIEFSKLQNLLTQLQPEVVVNCIGVIKQRFEAEANPAILGITLNALLPRKLAQICKEWGGRLIHFSTDCVFSGKRGHYTEEDLSDAEDLYGKTKFLGEVTTENAITLRTSIIGRELGNCQSLLEWFLSQNHKSICGFKRAFYSGITTNHLAEVVAHLIENHPKLSGIYQVTGQTISKYELLCLLRDAYGLDIEIIPDEEFFCDRSMVGEKFRRATGFVCSPWSDLTAQLANDPTPYKSWR